MNGFAKWLFALGMDAAVYEESYQLEGVYTPSRFFWKHNNSFKVHGPFVNASEASRHYEVFIAALKPVPPENVIFLDFQFKRRIAPP